MSKKLRKKKNNAKLLDIGRNFNISKSHPNELRVDRRHFEVSDADINGEINIRSHRVGIYSHSEQTSSRNFSKILLKIEKEL